MKLLLTIALSLTFVLVSNTMEAQVNTNSQTEETATELVQKQPLPQTSTVTYAPNMKPTLQQEIAQMELKVKQIKAIPKKRQLPIMEEQIKKLNKAIAEKKKQLKAQTKSANQ